MSRKAQAARNRYNNYGKEQAPMVSVQGAIAWLTVSKRPLNTPEQRQSLCRLLRTPCQAR